MPDEIFLNFCQYDQESTSRAVRYTNEIAKRYGCGGVTMTGWGARPENVTEV
jgi:hypothetical protein